MKKYFKYILLLILLVLLLIMNAWFYLVLEYFYTWILPSSGSFRYECLAHQQLHMYSCYIIFTLPLSVHRWQHSFICHSGKFSGFLSWLLPAGCVSSTCEFRDEATSEICSRVSFCSCLFHFIFPVLCCSMSLYALQPDSIQISEH